MAWAAFLGKIQSFGGWLFVIICLIVLIVLLAFVIWKVKNRIAAIIITAAGCIICTIPLISSINFMAETKAKKLEVSKTNSKLQKELVSKEITIENLNNEIILLKNTQLNMNSLNKIFQVALLETQLRQTDVHKEIISEKDGKGVFADRIENECLVISTHGINAKYGVDLKNIFIYEDEKNVLHVSGIKPKYIGSDKNETDKILSEIRQVQYKDGVVNSVSVLSDKQSLRKASKFSDEYEKEFQKKLSDGLETEFMDEATRKLAENFIRITLAPLKKEIEFSPDKVKHSVSIIDYLNASIARKEKEVDSLYASIAESEEASGEKE